MINIEKFNKSELEKVFSTKLTENGDETFSTTGNNLLDILFMAEYYSKHLGEVQIGTSSVEKLFSMFMRDPRFGLGYRDLGRVLQHLSNLTPEQIVQCGRYDDLYLGPVLHTSNIKYLFDECKRGNELAKKWMPRYSSKHLMMARDFAYMLKLNKQQYGHFIKCNTVESSMSNNDWDNIDFEKVPSLAAIKYAKAFTRHQSERYAQYLEDVKNGKKQLHISTTTVYDIYKNRENIDADLFYSKLEKISISCIPIIDVSNSMYDNNDSIGKALSIGKYLADCSSYCPKQFVTFSANPSLEDLRGNSYIEQLKNIKTVDWGCNTDLAKVMVLLGKLKHQIPDYLVILSDMEFDEGSACAKETLMQDWRSRGIHTKIVWWNFNSRNKTAPEQDEQGNIFLSGYNPMLLKYLEVGFDGGQFLQKVLTEYAKAINFQG